MTDKTRYILLALINCLLFLGFQVVHYILTGGADNRRLLDLNFASDFKLIMALLAMIVGAFVCNLSLLWRSRNRDVEQEMKKMLAEILKAANRRQESAR